MHETHLPPDEDKAAQEALAAPLPEAAAPAPADSPPLENAVGEDRPLPLTPAAEAAPAAPQAADESADAFAGAADAADTAGVTDAAPAAIAGMDRDTGETGYRTETADAIEAAEATETADSGDATSTQTRDSDVAAPAATAAGPDQPADLPPAACAAQLAERFPALFGAGRALPIKLRVQADIQQRAPGVFSRKSLSIFLHRHTTSTAYIKALLNSPHRFDLDGQPAGEVAEEHRLAATAELQRRRAIVDARRQAERDAQRQAQREAYAAARAQAATEAGAVAGAATDAAPPADATAGATPATRPPRAPRPDRPPHERGRRDGRDRPDRQGPAQGPRSAPGQEPQGGHRPPAGAHTAAGRGPRPQGPQDTHGLQGRRDGRPLPHPAAAGRDGEPRQDRAPRPERPPRPPRAEMAHVPVQAEVPAATLSPEQAAEYEARRHRAALLRAFDSSTLTRANFCVLKGITEAVLEAQLAQARAEAPPRAREPRPEVPPQRADRPDRPDRPDRGGPRGAGFGGGRPGGHGGPDGAGRSGPRPDIRTDLRHPRPVPAAALAPAAAPAPAAASPVAAPDTAAKPD
jgi:ProP effector